MKKRFIKIAIIAMLFMLVYATVVNALSFTVTLTPSSTVVKEGGEFTVKVAISNLDVGNGLVGQLAGRLGARLGSQRFLHIQRCHMSGRGVQDLPDSQTG